MSIWQGSTARGARLGLGAAATVLLAGSTYAVMALDGSTTDVAPSARLSADAATSPARAPQPAAPVPSPVAVAVPSAPVADLDAPAVQEHRSAPPQQVAPVRRAAPDEVRPRPVVRPATPPPPPARPVVERPARPGHHVDPRDGDRFERQIRERVRAEMRQEARRQMADQWHMPMSR